MYIFMKDKYTQIWEEAQLQQLIGEVLSRICEIRQIAKDYDLINSQIYLDFEDKLNQFSVADPND